MLGDDPKELRAPALLLVLVGEERLPGQDPEALLAQAHMMANRLLAEP